MKEETKTIGRPSKLGECLIKAKAYLLGGYEKIGEVIPSKAGLACYLAVHRSTLYEYAKQSEEFSDTLEGILALQESKLINKSLSGEFNPTISKLMLANHGYSEKVQQELTGANGGAIKIEKNHNLSNLTDEELRLLEQLAQLRLERDQTGDGEA